MSYTVVAPSSGNSGDELTRFQAVSKQSPGSLQAVSKQSPSSLQAVLCSSELYPGFDRGISIRRLSMEVEFKPPWAPSLPLTQPAGEEKDSATEPERKSRAGGARRGAGRKKIHIEVMELEKLYSLDCTDQEIADFFGVTTRTLERRLRRDPEFAQAKRRGRATRSEFAAPRSGTSKPVTSRWQSTWARHCSDSIPSPN
jgi:hypothetical protein